MASCDLLFTGARLIDGSGGASRIDNLAVDRDLIVDIGRCAEWQADTVIDASGLALAPGFIDSHTHDDRAIFDAPEMPFKLSQGVTTVIAGNCGISLAPLIPPAELPPPFPLLGETTSFCFPSIDHYRQAFSGKPAAVNLALLVGHSNLRLEAMPDTLQHPANPEALSKMQATLKLALQQGCIGMSTGLAYPPAASASTAEILQLASVLAEFDGAVYATHMRDEGDQVVAAVEEALAIGSGAKVPVVISHLKCTGPSNYGRSREILPLIDNARARQQAVSFDVYPYTASSTSLLPHFIEGCEAVLVAESTAHPECNGQLLDRIASDWGCSLEQACERLYPAAAIYFQMDDEDLERIMSHPLAMIGSDGIASMRTPHPRLWGTFTRVLGHYARSRNLFDLETAVHKMTGLTADRFGLDNRGQLRIGNYADLVLFNPDTVIDHASFDNPALPSEGIVGVWVNGKPGWQGNSSTGIRNGRFLTRHWH